MKFRILVTCLVLLAIGGLIIARGRATPTHQGHPAHAVTVYKTPTCGCCANFVSYLRTKNYEVKVVDMEQSALDSKKHDLGVAHQLDSCHTTVSKEGDRQYFIEGHIPYEAINKLLTDRPDIKGIGMPGMPSASPGMPGTKTEPFQISQVALDGSTSPYLTL